MNRRATIPLECPTLGRRHHAPWQWLLVLGTLVLGWRGRRRAGQCLLRTHRWWLGLWLVDGISLLLFLLRGQAKAELLPQSAILPLQVVAASQHDIALQEPVTILTQLDCLFAVVGDSWGGSGYPRSLLRPAAAEPHHCEARAARSWYMRGRLTERGGGIRTHVSSVSEVDEVGRGDREMRSV